MRSLRFTCGALLALPLILGFNAAAHAQGFSRFLELESPGRFSLRLFAVGYGAEKYGTTHVGFEIDQTITRAVSIIGRAIGYQVYQGTGFDSPLSPARRSSPRTFGLFEGGASFSPFRARHSRCWVVKMRATAMRLYSKTTSPVGCGSKAAIP